MFSKIEYDLCMQKTGADPMEIDQFKQQEFRLKD